MGLGTPCAVFEYVEELERLPVEVLLIDDDPAIVRPTHRETQGCGLDGSHGEALASEALRLALEEQRRESGRLRALVDESGGVAHDLNNMLLVIAGHTSMLLLSVGDDDPSRRQLEAIRTASERATQLIRQLLAFRREQP